MRKEDYEACGAVSTDTGDLVNSGFSIAGTEVAVMVTEQLTGGCKVSFRSRGFFDCSQLAGQFGGGGHKVAAGAFFDEPLETVRSKVLDATRAAMQ